MTTQHSADPKLLETLARDSGRPLDAIEHLYDQEYAALAGQARILNYVSLLALRRVRYRLQSISPELVH